MKTLRLILGDQLNYNHSWFKQTHDDVTYVMMEVKTETSYVKHHAQKIIGIFAAMRAFAGYLQDNGHRVIYFKLDDANNRQSFAENIKALIRDNEFDKFEYLLPDEYRVDQHLKELSEDLSIPVHTYDTEHFLTDRGEVQELFQGKKSYLMESFYRYMRKKHQILMAPAGKPEGGKWNFDKSNRNKLPKGHRPPRPYQFHYDYKEIYKLLDECGTETFGNPSAGDFQWPATRSDSLELLDYFIKNLLPLFGVYQDAMDNDFWSLYHSRLSFSLNVKMLHPLEVIRKVEAAHYQNSDIDIAQAEGFIRQILGWREFMRGIYWAHMPGYAGQNYFGHYRKLPEFYWTGKTNMNCLSKAIGQSLEHAYAHHIQRLMITGNFAVLNETHPDEVDRWYLGIYIDAFEWVEMPNTRGMSQFADGGTLATKPYVSSANYINKMSNYCKGCYYNPKKTTGEDACPFNSLFWSFLDKNRELFSKNRRMNFLVKNWEKRDATDRQSVLEQAEYYKGNVDQL
ncbi:MAG: cryptochrome/photolyase family protein [Bacteroidales bacterium]|nr:cryptochrome/photolyase family protein [Bacteroidales bacterium]MCF8336639.1 cryptochrome/photolyase family protein [Bacteroidales bacterium]